MKDDQLLADLLYLKLAYFREHHQALAKEAVEQNRTHLDFLSRLVEGEALQRKDRATQRRIQAARFPVVKTLEQFNWSWPKKINRPQVQNLFRLSFLKDKANVIFMGGAMGLLIRSIIFPFLVREMEGGCLNAARRVAEMGKAVLISGAKRDILNSSSMRRSSSTARRFSKFGDTILNSLFPASDTEP